MSRSPLIRLHHRPDSIIARKDSASEFSNNPTLASPRAVRTGAHRRDQVPTRWREVWQPSQSARGHPRHSSLRASDGGRSTEEIRVEGAPVRKVKRCEACSHPDRNPGRDDRRALAYHPAERVDRLLRSLTSLRLATDVVLHGQAATHCRRPTHPRRDGDVFPTAARRRPPESRCLSASPGAASPRSGRLAWSTRAPRYWRPDRRRTAPRVARLASAQGFPLGWGH